MIFLETFLVNLIKSQRIFAIICYYLKYLVSKFRILVHKRTILAWKLIFCSTLSTFRPKCPKTNGYNQTKNKLSLIIYFGNPKFWKCLGYSYDWLSIPPLDENLLFRTFVHWQFAPTDCKSNQITAFCVYFSCNWDVNICSVCFSTF